MPRPTYEPQELEGIYIEYILPAVSLLEQNLQSYRDIRFVYAQLRRTNHMDDLAQVATTGSWWPHLEYEARCLVGLINHLASRDAATPHPMALHHIANCTVVFYAQQLVIRGLYAVSQQPIPQPSVLMQTRWDRLAQALRTRR